MTEPIYIKIKRSVMAAENVYHRLVLLVGRTGSGKSVVLRSVADDLGTKIINLNLALSAGLLELTARQRVLHLPELLNQIVEKAHAPIMLDNLELLFDRNLQQDPLRLLQSISRNRTIVASWDGEYDGGKLIYAEAGHPEYRSYKAVDALIVTMDGYATIDLETN